MKDHWERESVDEEIVKEKNYSFARKLSAAKADLYNRGYLTGNTPCPECGCEMWERSSEVRTGSDEWEVVDMLERECPCCGHAPETSYDG